MTPGLKRLLAAWAVLVLAFLYVPLVFVVLNSFNTSRTFAVPPSGLAGKWWQAAWLASGAWHAVTAAALPPLEPPGMRSRSQGLRVTWNALFSVDEPMANSSQLSLHTQAAHASSSLRVTVASYGEMKFPRIFEAQFSGCPRTASTSFSAIGTPSRGLFAPALIC